MNKQTSVLSPWVFVTYGCGCNCEYCFVPKMESRSMSPETFEKMLQTSEKLIEKGVYDYIAFRLSGGEPLSVFDTCKDLATKWNRRMNGKFTFGILTNLINFTDGTADWMLLNNIGMQVSLDGLSFSQPLNSGESSADIVLKNIIRAQSKKINFQINTVLDVRNTDSLTPLCNYICGSFKEREWDCPLLICLTKTGIRIK